MNDSFVLNETRKLLREARDEAASLRAENEKLRRENERLIERLRVRCDQLDREIERRISLEVTRNG